jgi:protein-tyrosine phosphatase
MPKILFICTGNYFRSRFAEAWFNHRAGEAGLDWRAFSRGFYPHMAPPGISPHTARAVEELGIATEHVAPDKVKLSETDLLEAALVIAMKESEHRPYFERHYPEWTDEIQYWEAHDIDVQPPVQGLVAIRLQVDRLIAAIQSKK